MVHFTTPRLIGAVALLSSASAVSGASIPKRDSSINDPAVSAPAGTIESTVPSATAAAAAGSYPPPAQASSWYGSSAAYAPPAQASPYYGGSSAQYGSSNTWSAPPPAWSAPPVYSSVADYSSSPSYEWTSSPSYDEWSSSATVEYEYTTTTTSSAYQYQYTTTSTSSAYMSTVTYGSGSSNWNWGSNYGDCIQQCQVQYPSMAPPPPPAYTPPPTTTTYTPPGSTAAATTYTVIVAPSQGVLRYVPFTTNANPGDVVSFQWHAGPHTVTKSSELTVCNKTLDNPFASGAQNASFIFDQTVNDTSSIYFYCGIPNHCEKGMFGIINPPSVANNGLPAASNSSVEAMLPMMAANNTGLMNMWNYVNTYAVGTPAATWGSSYDLAAVDPSSTQSFVENVLYSRLFYAMNPSALSSGVGAAGEDLVFPADITTFAAANMTGPAGNVANATASSASTTASGTSAAPSAAKTNGARGAAVSAGAVFAVTAVVAAIMAL